MANNKFIERLKGQPTAGSLVEIKNTSAKTSFANMPVGSSNAVDVFSDHRNNATIVANGTLLWKIDGETLESVESVFGDGKDFSSVQSVAGSGLWLNASYTFPSTGDPNHPIAMVFNPNTKWVLKLCGDNLIVDGGNVVDFTLIVKIGSAHIFSKNFKVAENAGQFSTEFILDFEETNTGIVKAGGLAKLTLQLLCGTENASARIYNGMTVLTCLQRKVDASAVSSTNANVQDVLDGNIIPDDYFSNPEFIDQIEDGKDAYAVFNRDGDSVILSGWTPKEDIATAAQLNTEIQNRISADNALGLRIDNETTARENADTALQGQITSNKNAIDAHVADTANPHNVTKAQVGLGNVDNTSDLDKPISTATQAALNGKQDTISDLATIRSGASAGATAVQPGDLATVATTGNYNDLSNKPTIPTVGNGTITIKQGGETKGTFATNQGNDTTIELDAGGGGGSVDIDNLTITENASNKIQAVAVVNQNTGVLKSWTGTAAEYDAIATKDPETEYIITDDIGGPATVIAELAEGLNGKADVSTVAHVVTEFQAPTADNGYTWYRKYADGWVEQGGTITTNETSNLEKAITLPIEMSDNHYMIHKTYSKGANVIGGNNWSWMADSLSTNHNTTTTIYLSVPSNSYVLWVLWQVSGMAA